MGKAYRYFNDTYRAMNYLYVGDSRDFDSWLRKRHGFKGDIAVSNPNWGGLSFILEGKGGTEVAQFLWMREMDFCIKDYVCLSHECLHAAVKILSHRGIQCVSYDESEALNYLHEAIYGNFLNQLNRDRKKRERENEKTL